MTAIDEMLEQEEQLARRALNLEAIDRNAPKPRL